MTRDVRILDDMRMSPDTAAKGQPRVSAGRWRVTPERVDAIRRAQKALEQIEELKRLCEKVANRFDERTKEIYSKTPEASMQCWQGTRFEAMNFYTVLAYLDGDPTELKKLAGEE